MRILEAVQLGMRCLCLLISIAGVVIVARYDMEPRRKIAGFSVMAGCMAVAGVMVRILWVGEPSPFWDGIVKNAAVGALVIGVIRYVLCTHIYCGDCVVAKRKRQPAEKAA